MVAGFGAEAHSCSHMLAATRSNTHGLPAASRLEGGKTALHAWAAAPRPFKKDSRNTGESQVPVQMTQREPTPSADVAAVSPVPVQMWYREPLPVQMWQGRARVPVQMWQRCIRTVPW